jgi:hypothetical protein
MKLLRDLGLYLGHFLTAVIGTAIVTTAFGMLYRPRSIGESVTRVWILDIVSAGLLGFFAYSISRSKVGAWVWVPTVIWFAFGTVSLIPIIRGQSALTPNRGFMHQISGSACAEGLRAAGCRDFIVFTLPLIRSIGYSLGMFVAMMVLGAIPKHRAVADAGANPE